MTPNRRQITNVYTLLLLTAIAFFLGMIALRPMVRPTVVQAQSDYSFLYVEPRTYMLREPDGSQQIEGKVVIDMRNGDIYGFPTLSGMPYPVNTFDSKPPVATPMYLGRFDFSRMSAARDNALKH